MTRIAPPGNSACAELLAAAGADASAALPGGMTALHVAADMGDARAVAAMLRHGDARPVETLGVYLNPKT